MGTSVENLIKVGNQCYWLDKSINTQSKAARKKSLKRLFTIVSINGKTDGVYESSNDVITISDGTIQQEVVASELVIV